MNPRRIFIAYRFARSGSKYYGEVMKFVEKIRHKVKLVVAGIVFYALIVLGLLIYIAFQVS